MLEPAGFHVLSAFSPRFHLLRNCPRRWHLAKGAYRRCFLREESMDIWGREFEFLDLIEERENDQGMWHALMRRRRP